MITNLSISSLLATGPYLYAMETYIEIAYELLTKQLTPTEYLFHFRQLLSQKEVLL